MVLPAASAKAMPRPVSRRGTFQGLITDTTPIGRRTTMETFPCSEGRISPMGA